MRRRFLLSATILLGFLGLLWKSHPLAQDTFASQQMAPPSPQPARALALSEKGQLLLVANPESNSVTLIDTAGRFVVKEIAVGSDPRSVAVDDRQRRAFVANKGSNSVSVLDLAVQETIQEIAVGDRPVGVALSPDGRILAVTESGADQVRFIETGTLIVLASVPVADRPYGLCFTPDGRALLVSHLLSGQLTVLPVRPYRTHLPLILAGQEPAPVQDVELAQHGHQAWPYPAFTINTLPNVAPAPSVVLNPAGTRAYLPQTMANGQGLNTRFDRTVFPKVSVINLETWSHQSSEHVPLPETDQPVGLPWDVDVSPDGSELWVVNAASNDVSIVDISNPAIPRRKAHVKVGDNPRSILLSPDGETAYVNNSLAGTVSIIDTGTYTVTGVITSTNIPLPPLLLNGKRLFHSSARPELARAAWIACNSCHIEGELDGRTWQLQFTGPVPPGEPAVLTRNTTSLLGMIETYPLRWSAEWDESADSEFAIRFEQFGEGLIDGSMHPPLGTPNQGRSPELDSLAAFIDSLVLPARSHVLTPAEQRGQIIFESAGTGCATCHPPPLYTNRNQYDVGTADAPGEYLGPAIDTPTLRFLYDSAPYLHDGRALTLLDVLTTYNLNGRHGTTSHLTSLELADLISFLMVLPHSP